jgi:hypothetical protein
MEEANFDGTTDEADKAPEKDADRDGYSNLLEYATCTDPTTNTIDSPLLIDEDFHEFAYFRARSDDLSLVYYIEVSVGDNQYTRVPIKYNRILDKWEADDINGFLAVVRDSHTKKDADGCWTVAIELVQAKEAPRYFTRLTVGRTS